jgi:hypothetical protein
MQRPAHAPGDVPAEGAQAAGQRTTSLRLALLYGLAGLEGCVRNSSSSCSKEL